MLTWHIIEIIVRKVSYIFDEWWSARSAINIHIILFKRQIKCCASVDLQCWPGRSFETFLEKFLYIWRMMIGALSHQHSYNTVLNDKSNVVLVLRCNADLAQHLNNCKKGFIYIWRMMMCALSNQHSHDTGQNDKRNVMLVLCCNIDLVQHSNLCKKSFLYIWQMMIGALRNHHSYNIVFKR